MRKYFKDTIDDLKDPRTFVDSSTGQVSSYTSKIHNNDWTFHLGVFVCFQIFGNDECVLYD